MEPRKKWVIFCGATKIVSPVRGPARPMSRSGCTTTKRTITLRKI